MLRTIMVAAALLALILAPIAVVIAETQDTSSSGFTVEREATRVYGLYSVKLPEWMTYSKALVTGESIILAGSEYITETGLDNLTPRWVHSLLGKATSLAADSMPAKLVVAGASSGEVMVVSLKDPNFKTIFYTASRAPVREAHLANIGNDVRLAVVDELGFLYIVKVLRGPLGGGWFEAGPTPHKGALTGLYGFKVSNIYPTVLVEKGSYKVLGDRVAIFTDVTLPNINLRSPLLGGVSIDVFYGEDGILTPAYTGFFNISFNVVERRTLYYAIRYGHYIVPLPGSSEENGLLVAGNSTIAVGGLPPDEYEVVALYKVELVDGITGGILSSKCYTGSANVSIASGVTVRGSMVLDEISSTLGYCIDPMSLNKYYRPGALQALLLLNLTRLPESFDYNMDGRILLLPIPRELIDNGISNLLNHSYAILAKPGLGSPPGWNILGIDSILLIASGKWLLLYYLTGGQNLADLGYMQPQLIYFGSEITALHISPDASRIYVGLSSGALFKLEWLRAKPWNAPEDPIRNRYYIDSSLEIGGGSITSIIDLADRGLVIATSGGRLQLVREDNIQTGLKPLWRGPTGFEGVDTGLSNVEFGVSSSNALIAYSKDSNKLYIIWEGLGELQIFSLNIIPVSFRDDGSWFVAPPPDNMEVVMVDSRGAVLAVDRPSGGRALLYVPPGSYNLVIRSSWGEALTYTTINQGFNEKTLALVQEPGGRAYAEFLEGGVTIEGIVKKRPPKVDVVVRFVDIDGNPVRGKLKVVIEGPSYVSSRTIEGGVAEFSSVPLGLYRVRVEPLDGLYEALECTVRVTIRGVEPSTLELKPVTVKIVLRIVDKQFKTVVSEPLLLKLERLEAGSAKLAYMREVRVVGGAKIELPAGTYKATLIPAGKDLYQIPKEVRFIAEKPGDIIVELQPKTFTLTVHVKDVWGASLEEATVYIARTDGLLTLEDRTGEDGTLTLTLPMGTYEMRVEKGGYKGRVEPITITGDETLELIMEPGIIAYVKRYLPYMIVFSGMGIAVIIIIWARRTVTEKLKEEYF